MRVASHSDHFPVARILSRVTSGRHLPTGAYAFRYATALWGQSHAPPARCCSPALWFRDRGLDDREEPALERPSFCTLEEVAAGLGMRREQARIIEQRCLRRAYRGARALSREDLLAG
jgi:hypothetical protein